MAEARKEFAADWHPAVQYVQRHREHEKLAADLREEKATELAKSKIGSQLKKAS